MTRLAHVVLRVSLAFAFLYPALDAWSEPYTWLGYVPSFARGFVDDLLLLHAFGAVEIIIALWLLSGWKVFWPASAAAAMLLGIVIVNPSEFPILFRDLSLAGLALALALLSLPSRTEGSKLQS